MQAQRCVWLGKVAAVTAIAVVMTLPAKMAGQQAATPPPAAHAQTPAPHRRRAAAKSQRRRDRRRSSEHDGAARHHGAAARTERQRVGAEPRQLRRGAGQSVSESAGSPDAQERQEGHERGRLVEAAPAGDCRGVRSRSPRPRARRTCRRSRGSSTAPRTSRSADGRSSARSWSARSTTRRIPTSPSTFR